MSPSFFRSDVSFRFSKCRRDRRSQRYSYSHDTSRRIDRQVLLNNQNCDIDRDVLPLSVVISDPRVKTLPIDKKRTRIYHKKRKILDHVSARKLERFSTESFVSVSFVKVSRMSLFYQETERDD
ncbi:Hypothetical predicted protein [Marmota monax]|uniref:Uncharacterized protein n=1 Tax=Marmota monax TaxID=9995 RepID=A0A5E4AGP6_MARMO|nr:Hypothetical predicted protein [Marmota monax]